MTYYEANDLNSDKLQIGLSQGSLGNGVLGNPSGLTLGNNQYAYAAVTFTATEDGTYSFGQTYSPLDTVMILYDNIFDPTAPGAGALVANDDVSQQAHWNALGTNETISCSGSSGLCPLITQTITAGQTYTLWVSHFSPGAISNFEYPFTFYSTGSVVFGQYTGRSPINMVRSYYEASELGVTVDPMFVGGTLRMDQVGAVYGDGFTLSNMASNTIDQYGNDSVFAGVFSDAVSGSGGHIVIDDSSGSNSGSVTFAADNTYTGSTTLKGGVLIVSKDSNLGANSAALVLDGGTLVAAGSFDSERDVTLASTGTINVVGNSTLTLSGNIAGSGSLTKDGTGALVMSGNHSYTGTTSIVNGALIVGDSTKPDGLLSGSGNIEIGAGAHLGGYGSVTGTVINNGGISIGSAINASTRRSGTLASFTINGNVVNNSSIQLGSNYGAGDVLTINGDYAGNSGSLVMHAVLEGDSSDSDKLVITGNATGTTYVTVNNLGGSGAQVIDGIEVIQVGGLSNDDAFIQNGRIVAGAYDYTLVKGNAGGTNLQSWFLRSQLNVRPEAGAYLGLVEFNQSTFNHSFHDRQQLMDDESQSSWARMEYTKSKSKVGDDKQLTNKADRMLIHIGSDIYQNGPLHLGVMAGYSKGDIDTDSNIGDRKTTSKSDGYSAGVYGTWFDQSKEQGGLYLDTYVQYNWFDNKVDGNTLKTEKFSSHGVTVSAEAGYGFELGQTGNTSWLLEPQAQFIYNNYSSGYRTESNGTRVRIIDSDNFVSRVGLRLQGKNESVSPFITLNYWNNGNQAAVDMDGVETKSQLARNLFEVKMGGQVNLTQNVQLFGQLQNSFGKDSTQNYGGNIGVKVTW